MVRSIYRESGTIRTAKGSDAGMNSPLTEPTSARGRIDRLAADRPDIVFMAPFLVYLLLLTLQDFVFPDHLRWLAIAIRGIGALLVFELLARHLPPLGRPHVTLAVVVGVATAAMWAAGQHWLNGLGVPAGLPPLGSAEPEVVNPHDKFGDGVLLWTTVTLRILVACTAVPIVEEIFWRGFLLRAFIRWEDFEKIPMGQFAWRAFIGTALLSVAQHPNNWAVSIVCWLIFNALFYYTRSLTCLIITHAVTNLALYVYMVSARDWLFW